MKLLQFSKFVKMSDKKCHICTMKKSFLKKKKLYNCSECSIPTCLNCLICNDCSENKHNQLSFNEIPITEDQGYANEEEHPKKKSILHKMGSIGVSSVGKGISTVGKVGKLGVSTVSIIGKTGASTVDLLGHKISSIVEHDTVDKPFRPYDNNIPEWKYMFKPFSKELTDIKVGFLQVNNIEISNINNDDKVYCVLYLLDNNHKLQKTKTHKKHIDEYSVLWNEKKTFHIDSTLYSLCIEIYDDNILSDKLIKRKEIPLMEIFGDKRKDKLFFVDELHIRLTYDYKYSKTGNFISHFTIPPPTPIEEEDFSLNKLYGNAMELLELLDPVISLSYYIYPVLCWKNFKHSFITLLHVIFFSLYPWLIIFYIEISLIYYISWNYAILKVDKTIGKHKKEVNINNINPVLVSLVNKIISMTSLEPTLQIIQNLLILINDLIKQFLDLCRWKNKDITKKLLIGLITIALYTLIFSMETPLRYISLITGLYVLSMYSISLQNIQWFINSLISYFSTNLHTKTKIPDYSLAFQRL